jgi:hypothetical protein
MTPMKLPTNGAASKVIGVIGQNAFKGLPAISSESFPTKPGLPRRTAYA